MGIGAPTFYSPAYLTGTKFRDEGYLFEHFITEIPTMSTGILKLKSVHFKKPVTRFLFLSKSVVIFNIITANMTTLFERNEDRVTGFLK